MSRSGWLRWARMSPLLLLGCAGSTELEIPSLAFELLGRAPSFNGPVGLPIYQAEVEVPSWTPDSVSVCARGVTWFAVFEAGGDPDLPPFWSYPGTPIMAQRDGPGCVAVETKAGDRLALRLETSDTSAVVVTLTK